MQKPSSPVSSGNISPAIVGPSKDTKEVYVIGLGVLGLAIVIGAFWYFSGQGQSYATKAPAETLTNAQVANVLKTSTIPPIAKDSPTTPKQSSPRRPTWRRTIPISAFSCRAIQTSRVRSVTTTNWD